MKFENIYNEIKELFEKPDSDNPKWVENTSIKLSEIRNLWPEKNIIDIAEDLKDFEDRTEIIYKLSQLPRKIQVRELSHHGSLPFMIIERYMHDDDREEILEEFWKSNRGKSKLLIKSALARLRTRGRERNFVEKTPEDILTDELNELPKHYWSVLYEDALAWEYNSDMLKILKKLDGQRAKILKHEQTIVIDSLRHMVENNYIKRIKGTEVRPQAYNAFLDLME
tara:strand:- start:2243 stop:2917 length:675 start_codon:yes stop_codon:yes gene_type:complete